MENPEISKSVAHLEDLDPLFLLQIMAIMGEMCNYSINQKIFLLIQSQLMKINKLIKNQQQNPS